MDSIQCPLFQECCSISFVKKEGNRQFMRSITRSNHVETTVLPRGCFGSWKGYIKLSLESSTYLKSNVSCSEVICKHHDGGAVVGCELLAIGADVACNVLPCDGGQQRSSSLEGQVW